MANWAEGILSPLKTASGLLQEAIEVRDAVKFGDIALKLQTQIMAAQHGAITANLAQTEMAEEIRQLKAHMAELEAWDTEKEQYELQEIYPRSFAYAVKESARGAKPPHLICPKCYQDRKAYILQKADATHLFCPSCNTRIRFQDRSYPAPPPIPTSSETPWGA
jgi:hypothetical protein